MSDRVEMKIQQINDQYFVKLSDQAQVGPFETNAKAWEWIDRQDAKAIDMENTRLRVAQAFSER